MLEKEQTGHTDTRGKEHYSHQQFPHTTEIYSNARGSIEIVSE